MLGITNEQAIPIAADHREMVRFSDFESQKFESVRFALKELVEGAPMDHFEACKSLSKVLGRGLLDIVLKLA